MNFALAIPPAVLPILILSVLYGALFHLWKGETWGDLGNYLIASLLGFIVGQLLGVLLKLDVLQLGQVHLIEGTLFAWLMMFAFAWLKG